ncbi:MAG: hypothetical protein KME40_06820 [Komarekiella atlantica HA4396-MV6]|jgi:hypothetical protein|nr:hypothetical protein [Komarekiella atlantica HA4396-MV6]
MAQAIAKGVSQAEETTVELLQITGEQIVNSRCKNKGKKESEIIGIHFLPNYS